MKVSSQFVLALALLGAVGSWLLTAPHWLDLTSPSAVGGLFVGIASVVSAAFGVRVDRQ